MLRYYLLLIITHCLLASVGSVATEEITVNADDYFYKVSECDSSSNLRCWTVPSTYRISSETEKESPYNAERSGINLSSAANEFEGFQVALKAKSANKNVKVSLSDFSPPLGSVEERRVEIHRVGYHPTKNLADSLNRIESSTIFTVDSSTNTPAEIIYVRVYVPINTAKGVYAANLVIKNGSGSNLVSIPVRLTVFGFQLPVASTFKTQVNLPVEKFQPSFLSNKIDKLDWAKQFLLEYRMTPKSVAWPSGLGPGISWDTSSSPDRCNVLYDEDDENLPYSGGKNTKRWALGEKWKIKRWPVDANSPQCTGSTCPDSSRNSPGFSSDMLFQFESNSKPRPDTFCGKGIGAATNHYGTQAYNNEWKKFVTGLDNWTRLPENGNLENKAYIYVQNEPQNTADHKLANHLCHVYKSAAPGMKLAISEEAKPEIAERKNKGGYNCGYDIWIAHVPAYDKSYAHKRLVNNNEESWFYSLPQDGGAYFSPCEDDVGVNDGMNIRVISWTAFTSRIRGWAYYKMSIFFEDSYPMRPKMGAEIFRDSMEDYEYLFLANGGKHPMPNVAEDADPVANHVGFSFTAWMRDHASFAALRHELGRYIEGSRSKMAVLPQQTQAANPIYINFQNPEGEPKANPLVVNGNEYKKVGWEPFDTKKGYGWSGHGIGDPNILKIVTRTEGANSLQKSVIYNDWGREMTFDHVVPNGRWKVTVAVGYPGSIYSNDPQDIIVNGKVFNNQVVLKDSKAFTQEVDVKNGVLSIAFGKSFDKYCFIQYFYAVPLAISSPADQDTPQSTPSCKGPKKGKACKKNNCCGKKIVCIKGIKNGKLKKKGLCQKCRGKNKPCRRKQKSACCSNNCKKNRCK